VRDDEQIYQNNKQWHGMLGTCLFGVMLSILVCNGPSPYHLCPFALIPKLPPPRKHRLCNKKKKLNKTF